MRSNADAYSQMNLLDEVQHELGGVLYAKVEGKKIIYYSDKECTAEWSRADDSKLLRGILARRPAYYMMNDGFTYTFSKVVFV